MRFSKKLTVIFGVLFLIFGGLISAVFYSSNVRTLEVKEKEHLSEHALHVMDKIDRMLFERYADIQVLSTDPVISSRGATPAQITERLKAFQTAYKAYASLSFFDMNRVRIADTSEEKIGEQRKFVEYWIDLAEGKEFVVNVHKSITLNKIVIHFVQVVKDKKGIPFGVVVSRTPVDELNEIVEMAEATHKPGEFKIELLDRNGLILYSNKNKGDILKAVSEDWKLIKKSVASGIKNGEVKYTNPREDTGEEILSFAHESGYREYKGNDWTLALETPTSLAFASARELRNRVIILMLISSAIVLLLIYLSSNKISQSIKKMTDAADEISKGNLDVRVNITSRDETGRLADTFNRMASDLTAKENRLIEYGRELEAKVLEQTSELRKTNELLNKREASLAKAQQIARLGNWEFDFATGNVTWSDEMYHIFGLHPEQFKPSYEAVVNRVYPDDRGIVIKAAESALKEYKTYASDYRIVRPDGTVRYIHSDSELIFDENGKAGAMRGTAQDITERKHAEEKIRDSEGKFHSIFTEARDGIVLIDAESGFIIDCNPEFERQTGRRTEELKGMRIWEIRTPEKVEAARNKFLEIAASGAGSSSELEFQRPDGDIVSIEFRSQKIPMAGKEYIQSMSRDITERKKMEEENKKQMDELQRWYNAMLGREYRVIELKREVNELLGKTGQPPRYPSVET